MGNLCCGKKSSVQERQNLTSNGKANKAFSGEGRRLGTATESTKPPSEAIDKPQDDTPEPIYDANLTEEEREKIRADRAAAAEARLKKAGAKPVKKSKNTAPLKGPNTQPLMRWTAF